MVRPFCFVEPAARSSRAEHADGCIWPTCQHLGFAVWAQPALQKGASPPRPPPHHPPHTLITRVPPLPQPWTRPPSAASRHRCGSWPRGEPLCLWRTACRLCRWGDERSALGRAGAAGQVASWLQDGSTTARQPRALQRWCAADGVTAAVHVPEFSLHSGRVVSASQPLQAHPPMPLTTPQACDRIYVLSDGRVEEQGTHQELLSGEARPAADGCGVGHAARASCLQTLQSCGAAAKARGDSSRRGSCSLWLCYTAPVCNPICPLAAPRLPLQPEGCTGRCGICSWRSRSWRGTFTLGRRREGAQRRRQRGSGRRSSTAAAGSRARRTCPEAAAAVRMRAGRPGPLTRRQASAGGDAARRAIANTEPNPTPNSRTVSPFLNDSYLQPSFLLLVRTALAAECAHPDSAARFASSATRAPYRPHTADVAELTTACVTAQRVSHTHTSLIQP